MLPRLPIPRTILCAGSCKKDDVYLLICSKSWESPQKFFLCKTLIHYVMENFADKISNGIFIWDFIFWIIFYKHLSSWTLTWIWLRITMSMEILVKKVVLGFVTTSLNGMILHSLTFWISVFSSSPYILCIIRWTCV